MANLILYGAETNDTKEPSGMYSTTVFSSTFKRSGNYSVRTYNGAGFWFAIPDREELYIQYAICVDPGSSFSANNKHLQLKYNSNYIITTDFSSAPVVRVYSGNRSTLLITGTTVLDKGQWYVIELHVKIHDTLGFIELRVDGVVQGVFNGDTKPGSDAYINIVEISFSAGVASYTYVDDLVVNDISGSYNNSWPNGAKIVMLKPTGDDGTNEFTKTPSGGVHYEAIDEYPASGSDNLKATSANLTEKFTLEDLPEGAGQIQVVQSTFAAYKGVIGVSPEQIAPIITLDGTDYQQSDLALPTAPGFVRQILDSAPDGGVWTTAKVNAMKFGFKSRA